MELAHLRALRELRDRGSIAAVATALRVTPSAISQQLAALQRSAGVALTRLDGRRTVLTDAGIALADAAVGVESAMTDAHEAVARFHATEATSVSVSALASVARTFFPGLLAAEQPGDPMLALTDRDVAQPHYALLAAEIDLVIAHRMPGRAPWPGGVTAIRLLDEPLDLAFRVGHPLDREGPVSDAELDGLDWINVHEDYPLAESVPFVAARDGREPMVRHRVNDYAITVALLGSSHCVALLPRHTGRVYLTPEIRMRPIAPELAVRRRIDVLTRPETLHRTSVRVVLERLRAQAAALTEPRR